jgi:hypothetical protein
MFHATNDVDVEIHCVCQKINKLWQVANI